jgi:hypothetical protein
MKPTVGFKLPSAGVTPAPSINGNASHKFLTGTKSRIFVFNSKVQGLTLPKEA